MKECFPGWQASKQEASGAGVGASGAPLKETEKLKVGDLFAMLKILLMRNTPRKAPGPRSIRADKRCGVAILRVICYPLSKILCVVRSYVS